MHSTEQNILRKVTMNLPAELIATSMRASGAGLTETVREALKAYNHSQACKAMLSLRGKLDLGITYEQLKAERE